MSKKDKRIQDVKNGKRISPSEAQQLLKQIGYENKNTEGSHQTWSNCKKKIVILLNRKEQPSYLIDQLKEAIEEEGL
jgi:predicted metal-binding protein